MPDTAAAPAVNQEAIWTALQDYPHYNDLAIEVSAHGIIPDVIITDGVGRMEVHMKNIQTLLTMQGIIANVFVHVDCRR